MSTKPVGEQASGQLVTMDSVRELLSAMRRGDQPFTLPLVNVKEIFDLDLGRTNVVDGQLTVVVRGKPLPLF